MTDPGCLIQAGAGDGDVGHGHVVDRLLRFGHAKLLLQAENHHQRTHDPTAELHNQTQRGNITFKSAGNVGF